MQHMQLHCVYYTVYGVLKKKKERRRLRSMLFQVSVFFKLYLLLSFSKNCDATSPVIGWAYDLSSCQHS